MQKIMRFKSPLLLTALLAFAVLFVQIGCGKKSDESGASVEKESIQNQGSDTMVNLAQAWAEAYATVDSAVSIEVSGGGSGTGIAALINGTTDICQASRQMKQKDN